MNEQAKENKVEEVVNINDTKYTEEDAEFSEAVAEKGN
jgi:hypothetical protein